MFRVTGGRRHGSLFESLTTTMISSCEYTRLNDCFVDPSDCKHFNSQTLTPSINREHRQTTEVVQAARIRACGVYVHECTYGYGNATRWEFPLSDWCGEGEVRNSPSTKQQYHQSHQVNRQIHRNKMVRLQSINSQKGKGGNAFGN